MLNIVIGTLVFIGIGYIFGLCLTSYSSIIPNPLYGLPLGLGFCAGFVLALAYRIKDL